jgi:zinc protease
MVANKQLPLYLVVAVMLCSLLVVWPGARRAEAASMTLHSWHTKNGAKVMYVHAPQLPMVDIRVVFNAGSARDGAHPGLASLTNLLLNHGAGKWDTDQIAERFDEVGANYGASAERDMAVVRLRTLTDKKMLEQAMDTFGAVLQAPHFDPAELDRERTRTLVAIKDQKQSPGDVATLAFYKHLYGDHPYASPPTGTQQSVQQITNAEVKDFYKNYYVGKNAVIAIVGDVSRKQAANLAERSVGKLSAGEAAASLPAVAPLKKAEQVDKPFPSAQTHILVGQPGLTRGDKDYFALYVGNHALGGSGFGSRILKEIREKRGLAYSAYSYFLPMQRKGPFIMGLQTKNSQSQEALGLLRKTLARFIKEGPTQKELTHSKKNITGSFPLRIDSNQDMTQYAAMIGFYDLPLDYLDTFNDKVEQVSREQIRDAFQRRLDPDTMLTVLVGPDNVAANGAH